MLPTKELIAFLLSQGHFDGNLSDLLKDFLESEGDASQMSEALYIYLGNLGYTGQLTKRLHDWRADGYVINQLSVYEAGVFENGVFY